MSICTYLMHDRRQRGVLAFETLLYAVPACRFRLLTLCGGSVGQQPLPTLFSLQLTLILRRLQLKQPLLLLVCPRRSSRCLGCGRSSVLPPLLSLLGP